MKIKDQNYKKEVEVLCKDCPDYKCYWPRSDPGVFNQGIWYRARVGKVGWLCGTREAHGCPESPVKNVTLACAAEIGRGRE